MICFDKTLNLLYLLGLLASQHPYSDSCKINFRKFRFAWNAFRSNLLRTTLLLLRVTVGKFAIIAVFTVVDSLERSIKKA